MAKIQNTKFILLVLSFLFFAVPPTFSAEISFDSGVNKIGIGSQFEVGILFNTEADDINAVEGKLFFPDELLNLGEINNGNSIVNFWVEKPRSNLPGEIIFSGITPGGYKGEKGLLFSVTFQAKKTGEGSIGFHDIKALKNDGMGTPVQVAISDFQFSISEVSEKVPLIFPENKEDYEPPETFQPEIARDETMFEGKWFLVFATQDKNSGIDYYEIKESQQEILAPFRKWTRAESPYVLEDQRLKSYIFIKTADKAGNELIVRLAPKYPMKWYENWLVWAIIIIMAVILYAVWRILKSKIWNSKFIIKK